MSQRVVVMTGEEIVGGLKLLKTALGNGIMGAQLGAPVDSSIPEWLVSLTEKFQHPEGITDNRARLAGEWLYRWRWPSDPELEQYGDRWTESGREMLEAALTPECSSQVPVWDCPKGHRFDAHRPPLGSPSCPFCGSTQATIVEAAFSSGGGER